MLTRQARFNSSSHKGSGRSRLTAPYPIAVSWDHRGQDLHVGPGEQCLHPGAPGAGADAILLVEHPIDLRRPIQIHRLPTPDTVAVRDGIAGMVLRGYQPASLRAAAWRWPGVGTNAGAPPAEAEGIVSPGRGLAWSGAAAGVGARRVPRVRDSVGAGSRAPGAGAAGGVCGAGAQAARELGPLRHASSFVSHPVASGSSWAEQRARPAWPEPRAHPRVIGHRAKLGPRHGPPSAALTAWSERLFLVGPLLRQPRELPQLPTARACSRASSSASRRVRILLRRLGLGLLGMGAPFLARRRAFWPSVGLACGACRVASQRRISTTVARV